MQISQPASTQPAGHHLRKVGSDVESQQAVAKPMAHAAMCRALDCAAQPTAAHKAAKTNKTKLRISGRIKNGTEVSGNSNNNNNNSSCSCYDFCMYCKSDSNLRPSQPAKGQPSRSKKRSGQIKSQPSGNKSSIKAPELGLAKEPTGSCRAARCLQQVSLAAECAECKLIARMARIKLTSGPKLASQQSIQKASVTVPCAPVAVLASLCSSVTTSARSSPEPHDEAAAELSSLTASEGASEPQLTDAEHPTGRGHPDRPASGNKQPVMSRRASFRRLSARRLARLGSDAVRPARLRAVRLHRRPAPAPPSPKVGHSDWSTSSVDSGADSGSPRSTDEVRAQPDAKRPNLLSESELYSIEHFMKSHRSSTYVCHCMANLYFTTTRLVDNGRCSKPAPEAWQLSKTGVPVLTFDSGLARNRDRRRLSISLAERGSGFILWSDIIDHLSNYRAFSARLHGNFDNQLKLGAPDADTTCDTFHVMYLSTNHRIMVGLSFDDARSARLFLRQVEMVTADPANIALTGPKLAVNLGSVARLSRLLLRARLKAPHHRLQVESAPNRDRPRGRKACQNLRLPGAERAWSTLKRLRASVGARSDGDSAQEATQDGATLKPLVALAETGLHLRARAPRKCDISAPCLFQHVTQINLANLDSLYSRALVAPQPVRPHQAQAKPRPPKRTASSSCSAGSSAHPASDLISRQLDKEPSSAASSCYSSANEQERPTSASLKSQEPGKIRQVIRDLEAQASAELVEAKRRLMSDIAGQAVARANLTSQASHL